MLYDIKIAPIYDGYIAGSNDGIVTVAGVPARCEILVFDALESVLLQRLSSLPNGHYMIQNLNPIKKYMIMARDYNKEYEPVVWDYVTPATDLTIQQQQVTFVEWQGG